MSSGKRLPAKKKAECSKKICVLGVLVGMLIVQECLYLMYLCITLGYAQAAGWLTAAIGVGEAIIMASITGYLSLTKVDHQRGGITFEAAKQNNFKSPEQSNDSPAI